MIKHSEEFKREGVRIALTSGLPRERVAFDLGIGKATLVKWLAKYRPTSPAYLLYLCNIPVLKPVAQHEFLYLA